MPYPLFVIFGYLSSDEVTEKKDPTQHKGANTHDDKRKGVAGKFFV